MHSYLVLMQILSFPKSNSVGKQKLEKSGKNENKCIQLTITETDWGEISFKMTFEA